MKTIHEGSTQVVQVQHILLHQNDRSFNGLAVDGAVAVAGEGVDDGTEHLFLLQAALGTLAKVKIITK